MSFIPAGVARKAASVGLKLQTTSPQILLVGGIAGVVTTVVLASRATLKLNDVLADAEMKRARIAEATDLPGYSDIDRRRDKAVVIIQAAVDITKLYGPALIVGVASIAMLVSSHNILNRRNAALTAAYAALDKSFRAYRARVVEELGAEQDNDFIHAVKKERVTQVDETGKKKTVEKKVAHGTSAYGVFYDNHNPNWTTNVDSNIYFLRCVQNYANDKLQRQGFYLLNDLLAELGMEKTKAGAVVGWVADADAYGIGDGFVDLGIFSNEDPYVLHGFITGQANGIWINPNVDGLVYDKIDEINKARKS